MTSRPLAALLFVVLGAIAVPGCGQGDGGVCQLNSDCAAGLVCTCKLGGGVEARGVCRATETTMCTVTSNDSGPPVDADRQDGGTDAFVGADAASDAGSDAGGSDAGSDAGGSDAASAADTGTDASTSADTGADANADAG